MKKVISLFISLCLVINSAWSTGITVETGSTFTVDSGTVTTDGDVNITGGTLTANSGTITVGGNWNHSSGTFNCGLSSVIFNGTTESDILGNNNFYALTIASSINGAKTVRLGAGNTQSVSSNLSLTGYSGGLLTLCSTQAGSQGILSIPGSMTKSVYYVNVKDNRVAGANTIVAYNSTNSGDNTNWLFSNTPPNPDLGTVQVGGRIYAYHSGKRLAVEDDSGVRYYHPDHLGSTSVMSDATGAQASYVEYDPYGTIITQTGNYTPTKFYTGKELDISTGLYDYGARHYDSTIGRFITADQGGIHLDNPQSLNRYSYCLGNPIKYIDPTGSIAESYDVLFFVMDCQAYNSNPSFLGGLAIALDAVALVTPYVPAVAGLMIRGAEGLARGADTASHLSEAGHELECGGKSSAETTEHYLEATKAQDFSTPKDATGFYSGADGQNHIDAREFADRTGTMLIEDTPGGKWLTEQDLYNKLSREQARQIWDQASAQYAQQATGDINLFVDGANPEGTYSTVEKPILEQNEQIENTTYWQASENGDNERIDGDE